MKSLLIGSGGREHALAWKLARSPRLTRLWCAPGNAGIAEERLAGNGARVECITIGAEDLPRLLAFAREQRPDLTVVGPDTPLAMGIVDLFEQHGLRIWGQTKKRRNLRLQRSSPSASWSPLRHFHRAGTGPGICRLTWRPLRGE